jgi:hypothetical protein
MDHNESPAEISSDWDSLEDAVPGLRRLVVQLQTAFPSLSERSVATILGLPEAPPQQQPSDLAREQK